MTYYEKNREKYEAYRKAKKAQQMSDEQVRQYLASAMPETWKAIQEGVKKNKEPYNQSKEAKAKYLYTEYRRYDREHGYEFGLTKQWILDNIINGKCAYCGNEDWTRLGTDRIDNTKGHTVNNVVCACEGCNNRRQSDTINEWLSRCRRWRMIGFIKNVTIKVIISLKKLWDRFQHK